MDYSLQQKKDIKDAVKNIKLGLETFWMDLKDNLNSGDYKFQKVQKTIENLVFQLIIQSYCFLVEPSDQFQFTYKSAVLVQKLFKSFMKNHARQTSGLTSRVRQFTEEDSSDEGFSSEDERNKQGNEIINSNQIEQVQFLNPKYHANSVIDQSTIEGDLKEIILQKNSQIKQLEFKLQHRENYLAKLTTGYLKEIQVLKDQLYQTATGGDSGYLNVKYFDMEDSGTITQDQVKHKLLDIKALYEQKIRELQRIINHLKKENEENKNQIQTLQTTQKSLDNPELLMKRIFQLEPNPYKFWKLLQVIIICYQFLELQRQLIFF